MEIAVQNTEEMEGIIARMRSHGSKCAKSFQCYESGLEQLCTVKGIGAFDTIECAAEDSSCCGFSFAAVGSRYCGCPLRRYIAVNFHR